MPMVFPAGTCEDSDEAFATGSVATHTADQTVGAGAAQVAAANPNRVAIIVQNTGTATARVCFGGAASATTGIQLLAGASLVVEAPYVCRQSISACREGSTNTTIGVTEFVPSS